MNWVFRSGDLRRTPCRFPRSYVRPLVGAFPLAMLIAMAGCQAPPPDHATEATVSMQTGIGDAITFKSEGGPLDEPALEGGLTATDALRRAMTTDPRLQAALARVRIALAEADQVRLLPNPVVNVVYRFNLTGSGESQIEASLSQDLIQVLMIPNKASAADNRLRQAASEAVALALDIASEAQELYARAQAQDRLVVVIEQRRGLLDKMRNVAQSRLEAGEGARSDLTTLDTQRVELEVEVADAKLQQRETRLSLARAIGEPSGAATWPLDAWETPPSDNKPESQWIQTALTHRPEIQAISWQLKALGDDAALVKLLPWDGTNIGVDAQRDGDWAVGPSVSAPIPIFDMGQAKKSKVTAEQIEARHQLVAAQRKVVEEVRLAYRALADNQSNLKRVRNEFIPLQEQRRSEAQDAYQAGQTDVTPLFLAEEDLRSAQAKAVQIEGQTAIALVRLHRAVGGSGIASSQDSSVTQPVSLAK